MKVSALKTFLDSLDPMFASEIARSLANSMHRAKQDQAGKLERALKWAMNATKYHKGGEDDDRNVERAAQRLESLEARGADIEPLLTAAIEYYEDTAAQLAIEVGDDPLNVKFSPYVPEDPKAAEKRSETAAMVRLKEVRERLAKGQA